MNRKAVNRNRYRYIPLVLALVVAVVPVYDLATRVATSRSEPPKPTPQHVPVPDVEQNRADTPPVFDLPGTVLHAHRSPHLDRFSLEATPRQLADLVLLLDRSGMAKSVTAERAADRWIVRIERDRITRASRGSPVRAEQPTADEIPIHDLASVFAIPADETGREHRTRVGELGNPAAQTTARRPFGIVEFSSGRRLSWRWNTDLLFLEEAP